MQLGFGILALVLAAIVQSTAAQHLDGGPRPDLVLLLVLAWSMLRGLTEGIIGGIAGGLALAIRLDQARAYRTAAPEALVCYGTKAFPNVSILRLFAEEGLGADVSTLGELRFALAAGVPGDRLVVHGNNKADGELRAAAEAGAALVVLDSLEEVDRAAAAGVRGVLVRVTSGIEADTHESIRTGWHGSKFGLPAADALEAVCIEAVEAGQMTKDLAIIISKDAPFLTTQEFLGALDERLQAKMAG